MWKGLKEFTTYNKRQRKGVFSLLLVILALWMILLVDDYFYTTTPTDFTEFEEAIANWQSQDSLNRHQQNNFTPFVFNPNLANDSVWQKLGLASRQIQIIENFKAKGGKFYSFRDLERIYSLDSSWLSKVEPYARFPERSKRIATGKGSFRGQIINGRSFDPNMVSREEMQKMGLREWQAKRIITYREKVTPYRQAEQLYKVYGLDSALVQELLPYVKIDTLLSDKREPTSTILVELNSSDSLQLIKVRGIGPAFAHRILKYRDRLGGFYSKDQLMEVYGIDEERYQKMSRQLTLDTTGIRKISLNEASFKEMLRHPYLEYAMVKSIFNFREKIRPFRSESEIQELEGFDAEITSKLLFYLKL